MKLTRQEEEQKHLHSLLYAYLEVRGRHKKEWGQKNRFRIKETYQEMADKLYWIMPDDYHFQGYVFHKAILSDRRCIQIYTEESWDKAQKYLATHIKERE